MARRLAVVTEEAEEDPVVALQSYDDAFLECRDLRHAWVTQGAYRAGTEVRRRLACSRCGTERTDHWSPTGGERYGNSYRYVDGYRVVHGATAALVRQEVMNRVTVYETEEQMLNALFAKPRRKRA